jgi:hypothetical protein
MCPPQMYTVGAKINARFGQNIKISKKICLEKFFVCLRKLEDIRENF